MKEYILKHKTPLLVSVILLIIIIICCIIMFNIGFNGRLVNYHKAEENDGHTIYYSSDVFISEGIRNFSMTEDTIDDLLSNPWKYTAYWINTDIQNVTKHTIYNLKAKLVKEYDNLWLDTSSLCEWPLDLEALETYNSYVLVIVKTENMTEGEIDQLVRSIKIRISAMNTKYIPIYNSRTICFDE